MASTATIPVVTIDGPGGAGKGTISRLLAEHFGWHYLDSGAMYRALALAAQRRGIGFEDAPSLATLARDLDVHFAVEASGAERIELDGRVVSAELRSEESGSAASRVAAHGAVREALLARQRAFRVAPGLVADGRDMGTAVFTDAGAKIYLTASASARAERRYKQLKEKGISANLAQLRVELEARDIRDAERANSPLRPAEDAMVVDSTALGIEACLERVTAIVTNRLAVRAVRD